jgi:ribonuclease J
MSLRILPIGGMGNVTQNMYVYELGNELLIVDCGIGFPTQYMPGVDVMIPDITYITEQVQQGKEIVGMILTHGHDDHIAATGYLLPELPEFPIFASPLTAAFASQRMHDQGVERNITVIQDHKKFKIGTEFEVEAFPITHSVPDTRHFAIYTSEGLVYHGADFKIDLQPVDGVLPDFDTISRLGNEGVLCLLMDCLRVENSGWSRSESEVHGALEEAMMEVEGKIIVTLMSSHIHRIQQVVDIANKLGRHVCFIGRSVEQNVESAMKLKKLDVVQSQIVDKRNLDQYRDSEICIIIAGSQGQEGSSLVRAVYGEHQSLQIKESDRVIFSSDAIPGNEIPYYGAIDELARNGVRVLYPDVMPGLHSSGHGGAKDQQLLLSLVKPKYVFPMGGQDRHRAKFHELVADAMHYKSQQVLLPKHGQVIELSHQQAKYGETLTLVPRLVDGLGVGDVGPTVLSDRQSLGREGMIVLVLPKHNGKFVIENINIVSRGFVFMKEAQDVIKFIQDTTAEVIEQNEAADEEQLKKEIEKKLSRKLYKIIRRAPLIMPVIVEV